MSIVSVDLMGGLGNQLFQIFAAFAYAIEHNKKLIFPYEEVLHKGKSRPTYWKNFLNTLSIFTTANTANGVSNSELFSLCDQYQWLEHHYSPIPFFSQNILLRGYFQSPKYFQEYESQIIRMMHIEEMKYALKEEYAMFFTNEPGNIKGLYTISMHFRMGDYKGNPCHPVLKYEYYVNALTLISSVVNTMSMNIRVLYFCEKEDNDIVNSIIERLKEDCFILDFIKVGDEVADWKQILLMSLCDSQIIANSTFSWWGAYFAKKGNMVCYPDGWFSGPLLSHNMSDMFLEEWIKIIY